MKRDFEANAIISMDPSAAAENDAVEGDEVDCPRSIMIFCDIFTILASTRYGVQAENINMLEPEYLSDGSFALAFYGEDEGPVEECLFNKIEDFEGMYKMLAELKEASIEKGVVVHPDQLRIYCKSKMALFNAVKSFFDQGNIKQTLIEDTVIYDNTGEVADAHFLKATFEMPQEREHKDSYYNAYINNPNFEMNFRLARQIPFMSLEHYYLELVRVSGASIPHSWDHLLKIIRQEDGLSVKELKTDALAYGGIN